MVEGQLAFITRSMAKGDKEQQWKPDESVLIVSNGRRILQDGRNRQLMNNQVSVCNDILQTPLGPCECPHHADQQHRQG